MSIKIFLGIADAVLFVIVFLAMFFLIMALIQNNIINRIRQWMKESEENRTSAEERLRLQEGAQEKDNIFYRLDLTLNQSGVRKAVPFLSTEMLLLFSSGLAVTGLLLAGFLKSWSYGLLTGAVLLVLPYMVVRVLADFNHGRIEKQIIHFLNMVENYSHTQDNLITIFGKVYPFLDEPLRTAVRECYMDASNTGDISTAFRRLETNVVHERLNEILQNLELCGMHEANYQVIIAESRDIMTRYMKSKEMAKSIANRGKIEFAALLVCAFIMINVMNKIMEVNIISMLAGSILGMFVLIYMGFVIVFGFFSIISVTRS